MTTGPSPDSRDRGDRIRDASLDRDDLRRIQVLVDRIDEIDDLETFGRVVAEGLLSLLPGLSASYNEVNPDAGRAYAVIAPEPEPAWWAYYTPIFERFVHEHPYVRHLVAGGDGSAHTWDELPGGDRFRTTELFRRFYGPLGIETQLSAQLPAPDGIVVGLSVNRGADGFSERDRLVLDTLRSHLVRAYRLVQLTEERDRLGSVLGGEGWQVVLVDDDGVVISSTTDGSSGCRRGEPLPPALLERFQGTATAPFWVTSAPPAPVRLSGVASQPDVTVAATVVRNRVPPHVLHLRFGAALPVERIRELGLSERQAAVAQFVAGGATNATIAAELGISPATVKKHLEQIYRVLGVGNRAAAVAALTSAV